MTNIQTLLTRYQIPYITAGPNVARGNINIACPFCGPQDPSYHLGIRLDDGVWGCWRDPLHRGRSVYRLFRRLLGWTRARTQAELGIDRELLDWPQPLTSGAQTYPRPALPANFRRIDPTDPATRPHWAYLENRGFSAQEIETLIDRYDLRAAATGEWARRVLIPIYDRDGGLLTWVGRAIGSSMAARYKAVDKSQAIPTTEILWLGCGWESRVLCVTEGPFDAMNVELRGEAFGLSATCVFGSGLSTNQETLLRRLAQDVDIVVIALDRSNLVGTLELTRRLVGLPIIPLLPDQKDPGEMSRTELGEWVKRLGELENLLSCR